MQNVKELSPLMQYQPQWLVIAIGLVLIVAAWIIFVLYRTRYRVQKTISNLKPEAVTQRDLGALKKKYSAFITQIEIDSRQRRINVRTTHQQLSQVVRLFAYEASGFRAQVMTLADIKKSNFPQLSEVIATYYPHEFKKISDGTGEDAIAKARQVVSSWQ